MLHLHLRFVAAAIIFDMVCGRRTNTKQCNHEKNKKRISFWNSNMEFHRKSMSKRIFTIENHNDTISPISIWNSLLSPKKRISISDFNEHLIFEILVRLPATSLHELRRVCKKWLHIISDPYFIDSHLDRARFQLNVIERSETLNGHHHSWQYLEIGCKGKITASCNGLLLVENELAIHVSNPATKQLLTLPTCSIVGRRHPNDFEFRERDFCRFGYAPSTREYKVLHFFLHKNQPHCEILTLGSNAWRRVDFLFRDLPLKINVQVMLNGVLHWVVGYEYIMSMNVAEETFDEMPVPSCAAPPYDRSWVHQPFYLMEIGGCLSLMVRMSRVRFEVWMLKDFRRKEWMRLYSIDGAEEGGTLFPIASLRNEEVIFQSLEWAREGFVLYVYNLRLGKMVEVRIYPGVDLLWANMITHFHSLASWKIQSQSG